MYLRRMNIPDNLKYTKEHEWVRLEGDVAVRLQKLLIVERAMRGRLFGMEGDWEGELKALENSSASAVLDQAAAARAAADAMLTGTELARDVARQLGSLQD